MERRLIDKKVALGIVTMFRATPWTLMGDKRGIDMLVGSALGDAKRFLDSGDLLTVLRGTMQTWLGCLGVEVRPEAINGIAVEVARQVDQLIADQYDDGLGGQQGGGV